jgi:rRNA maturation RNase YbeY
MKRFSLAQATAKIPAHPYERMKDAVLGKEYTLTLAFVAPKKAQALNKAYRKKSYVPNVLSFPLTDDIGEIYIALSVAKKESKRFLMTYEGYVGYLFIHGLLHLKGLEHGKAMDKDEKRLKERFKLA